jgi:predicted enzyme related to lactoylglutathione lyase
MNVEGITWHAIVLEPEPFAATKTLIAGAFGLTPAMDLEGFALYTMPNGTVLELYAPEAVPPYGYNGAITFGFRVDDIEAASRAVEVAGGELLGDITRMEDIGYAYRHFRGPDGRVYGLNEQRASAGQPA